MTNDQLTPEAQAAIDAARVRMAGGKPKPVVGTGKSKRSIGKSRNARLNQTKKHAERLIHLLAGVAGAPHTDPIMDAEFWFPLRDIVSVIAQCAHEANAYNNVMVPDGVSFDDDEYGVAEAHTSREPNPIDL